MHEEEDLLQERRATQQTAQHVEARVRRIKRRYWQRGEALLGKLKAGGRERPALGWACIRPCRGRKQDVIQHKCDVRHGVSRRLARR